MNSPFARSASPLRAGAEPTDEAGRELRSGASRLDASGQVAKRTIDFSLALVALFALAPLMLIICLAIRYSDRGPAIFRQTRVGRGGRRFTCFKFRSMVLDTEEALRRHLEADPEAEREWRESQKLRSDPRVTRMGLFLRRSSLDELPQIFNILSGDMSFVGPRPIVPSECARYGKHLSDYMSVRPGLTGPWQIGGRSDCSYAERVRLDAEYARNWRVATDIAIIVKTVPIVLSQRGSC